MTAPRRQSGIDVERRRRQCDSKNRYPNEATARAAGLHQLERNMRDPVHMLWVYYCSSCRGWHLTRRDNGRKARVTEI